jgi:parallel beta-helix repeat protein
MNGSVINFYEYDWFLLGDVTVINNRCYATDWVAPCLYRVDLGTGNLTVVVNDPSLLSMYDVTYDGTYFYIDEWSMNRYDINGTKHGTTAFNGTLHGSAWDGTYYWTLNENHVIQCWTINWPQITEIPSNAFTPPTDYCRGLWFDGQYFWTAECISGTTGHIYQFSDNGTIINQWNEPVFGGWAACVIQGNSSPSISNVNASPSTQQQGQPVNISCDVTDNDTVGSVTVSITHQNTTIQHPMDSIPGTDRYYYCQASGYNQSGLYTFAIQANDTNGNTATSSDHQFYIYDPAVMYVDDDFAPSTPGWQYDRFASVQDGIDTVATNGTVHVANGTYYENVIVNKPVDLIGESRNSSIDGDGSGDVVYVTADDVTIVGFTMQNSGSGWPDTAIKLDGVQDCHIESVTASDNHRGIWLKSSDNNTITNTTISDNHWGVALYASINNSLYNNYFDNTKNAYDTGNNRWNISRTDMVNGDEYNIIGGDWFGGNYWSDYDEPSEGACDNDSDGIVDSPYNVSGGDSMDMYPLTRSLFHMNVSGGWNLVAIPGAHSHTASSLGQNISGCSIVARWNATSSTFESYLVGVSPPGMDYAIKDGVGYFVYMDNDSGFSMADNPISGVSVDLYTGWNTPGWYNDTATNASSLGAAIDNCTIVAYWNASSSTFESYLVGVSPPAMDFHIERGVGVFVYVTKPGVWHGEG